MNAIGQWTLLDVVGQGAAATVWRGTDFERTVTIKVMESKDPKARESLERERRLLLALDHPNLPHILDTCDNPPALIFDSRPAQTYGDLLGKGMLWTIALRQRADMLTEIAAVLDWLHEKGIVHRDVKPAHLTATTPPLLLDFGIAHALSDPYAPDEDAGTAAYMPPPHERVSPARDAYGFAVSAYEILFGSHPLLVASDRDIAPAVLRERAAEKIRRGVWRKPTSVPPWELPPDLRGAELERMDELFSEALGSAESRPKSIEAWIRQISSCIPADDSRISVAPLVMPEAFAPAHTAHEVAASLRTGNTARIFSRRTLLLVAAILVILIAVLILLRR